MKFKLNRFEIALSMLGALILLFVIAPIVGMFLHTSKNDWSAAICDIENQQSIIITLVTSAVTTLFFAISAIPLAYILARKNFILKNWVLSIINLPIIIPHTAAGIAILSIISPQTGFGKFLESMGISFINNPFGIGLAMAYVSVPFLLNAAYDGFCAISIEQEQAAAALGASPLRVFRTISIPLAKQHLISGLILMFSRGLSEFGAIIIIAYHPMVTPVLIWEKFSSYGLAYARPLAVLFVLICMIIFTFTRYYSSKKQENA